MQGKSVLERLLDGESPQVRYAEIHGILQGIPGYNMIAFEGPHRCWKHHASPNVLYIRDNGDVHMYSKEIAKVAQHLREVKDSGGF